MTVGLALLVGAVIVVLAAPRIVELWRGGATESLIHVTSFFLPTQIARGFARGIVVLYATIVVTLGYVGADELVPGLLAELAAVRSATILAYLFLLALLAAVVLFNRPAVVVPPHLRGQPGALRAWLGRG